MAAERVAGWVLIIGSLLVITVMLGGAAWAEFTAWWRAQHNQPPRECRPGCPVCEVARLEWAARERRAHRTRRGVR